nr:immunoglobulin light chain junction region [Macaca mulatta]MPO03817.1 immunoglobulin light chain junction region [Macaca mulatta]MPO03973.1 immunoglobulin light chain junction region [Macaca mulatta]MPO04846.1 immunoglobulin light chain junction region [Macaca mulatta]MPO04872.1 immunoglobulin light chain junction region [Macaca mulatta]
CAAWDDSLSGDIF